MYLLDIYDRMERFEIKRFVLIMITKNIDNCKKNFYYNDSRTIEMKVIFILNDFFSFNFMKELYKLDQIAYINIVFFFFNDSWLQNVATLFLPIFYKKNWNG